MAPTWGDVASARGEVGGPVSYRVHPSGDDAGVSDFFYVPVTAVVQHALKQLQILNIRLQIQQFQNKNNAFNTVCNNANHNISKIILMLMLFARETKK